MLTFRRRGVEPVRSGPRARLAGATRTDRTPAPGDAAGEDLAVQVGWARENPEPDGARAPSGRGLLAWWRARRAEEPSPVMAGSPFAAAGAKAVPVLAALALMAGVAAFVEQRIEVGSPAGVQTPLRPSTAGADLATSSLAADAGLRTVQAWGAATRASSTALEGLGLALPVAPRAGLGLSGLRVASVSPVTGDPSVFEVLVAATAGGHGRYFSVPVQVGPPGQVTALALPAPAPGPPIASPARLGYATTDLAAASPVVGAATGFLTAYLAGLDVTRYTAPGTPPATVSGSPLPLERVLRVDATADRELLQAPAPADGSRTAVLVTFTTRSAAGPVAAQLALSLAARAGRWEVVSIDPAPRLETTAGPDPTLGQGSGPAPALAPPGAAPTSDSAGPTGPAAPTSSGASAPATPASTP